MSFNTNISKGPEDICAEISECTLTWQDISNSICSEVDTRVDLEFQLKCSRKSYYLRTTRSLDGFLNLSVNSCLNL